MADDTKAALSAIIILVVIIGVNIATCYILNSPPNAEGLILSLAGFIVYKLYQIEGQIK